MEGGIVPIGTSGKWKCLTCMKELSNKKNAMRHFKDAHFTFEKPSCGLCGKVLKNDSSLITHLKCVHGMTLKDLQQRIMPFSSSAH